MTSELETKVARVRAFCAANGLAGALLRRRASFAWLTCGGNSTVERSVEGGVADLLVTSERLFVVASEIERYRIVEEELGRAVGEGAGALSGGLDHGCAFELVTYPWGDRSQAEALEGLRAGRRMAADCAVEGFEERAADLAALRFVLTPEERERVRRSAQETARHLEAVCRALEPGMTEYEAAARVMAGCVAAGGDAPVALVAFDGRIHAYRHPAPTGRRLERRALLGLCAERGGLITSVSRVVSFGAPDADLARRHAACMRVNAAFLAATVPGALGSEVFARGVEAYAATGYPDEWRKHHQGGPLGYACRDWIADRSCRQAVNEHQLFSWNPTIAGTKVEDTVLVTAGGGLENLTDTPSWPRVAVAVEGKTFRCPDLLVR